MIRMKYWIYTYIYPNLEIIMLLLILLIDSLHFFSVDLKKAILIFYSIIVVLIILEVLYLFEVITKKRGFIGLPITICLYFESNIIQKLSLHKMQYPLFSLFCGMIVLTRIIEVIYLHKKQRHKKTCSYKGILWSTFADLLFALRHIIFIWKNPKLTIW